MFGESLTVPESDKDICVLEILKVRDLRLNPPAAVVSALADLLFLAHWC